MQPDTFSRICTRHRGIPEAIARELTEHLAGTSGAECLPGLAKALVNPDSPLPEYPRSAPADHEYADNLRMLRKMVEWRSCRLRPETARQHLRSGVVHDNLVPVVPVEGWSPIVLLTHALLAQIRPAKEAAIVVSMRDEGISILEWIAHYRAVGFTGIFVYTNDSVDGSGDLLRILANHGVVTLIDNITSGRIFPQGKAFAHSLHFLPELRDYEWVLYADADELLVPAEEYDWSIRNVLKEIASRYPDRPPSAICYHWRWFISNFEYARTEGLMLERFQHALPQTVFKSVVRLADVLSMRQIHMPEVVSGSFFVDSALDVIHGSLGENPCREEVWAYRGNGYRGGQLNHYWCKSFEEFLIKKHRSEDSPDPSHRRGPELFFNWNAEAKAEYCVPPPPLLLERLRHERQQLTGLSGMAVAEAQVNDRFRELVDGIAGPGGAAALYDDLARRFGPAVSGNKKADIAE
jgi:hypothetical protein